MLPKRPRATRDAEYERDHHFGLELARFFDDLDRAHHGLDTLPPDAPPRSAELSHRILLRGHHGNFVEASSSLLRHLKAIGAFIAEDPGTDRGPQLMARVVLLEMLERSRDLDAVQIALANERFARAGLPTLQAMQTLAFGAIPTVVARGRIETESEYFLVMARLVDPNDSHLSTADRTILAPLSREYQQRTESTRRRTTLQETRAGVTYYTISLSHEQISSFVTALTEQGFPIRTTTCGGAAGHSWRGTVHLSIESDDLVTRERVADWLRHRPEVTSVEVDLTGPWNAPGTKRPPH